jgi:pimeloyl-ACP methyl ester carboxylesterase
MSSIRAGGTGGGQPKFNEHYATSFDGTRIFYNSIGEGFPLICTDGIACDMYAWKYIVEKFAGRCRVIRWNFRGHGRSEMPANMDNLTLENCADDMAAVMEDAGIEKAVLLGHSMGVQVIFETYRRHPDKVKALVPICGSYGHPLSTLHDNNLADKLFPIIFDMVTANSREIEPFWRKIVPTNIMFRLALLTEINGDLVKQADFMPYLDHVSKLDLNMFIRMLKFANGHTAKDMLHTIKVPTLIFGAEFDKFTPVWLSRDMNRLIPGSEFQFLPLGTHTGPIEHPDLIELRLDRFLRDHFPSEYAGYAATAKAPAAKKASRPRRKKRRAPRKIAAVEPAEQTGQTG